MKAWIPCLLAAAAALPLAAQAPEAGTAAHVESLGLRPGESASFVLAPGFDHQLLVPAAAGSPRSITVRYEVVDGASRISASSRAGHPLRFSVLADPDGNGGYAPMGEIDLPGDGTPVARSWPGSLGAINVGGFVGGPHGDHGHDAPGRR